MALRATGSRLRARSRCREAAQCLFVSAGLLPFRRSSRELLRLRPAEFAGLPGAESVADTSSGGTRRLSEDDRGRCTAREASPSAHGRASGVRGDDPEPQYYDVSICATGPEASARI